MLFVIYRALHTDKIYHVKNNLKIPKIGELIFLFIFFVHIHAPLLVKKEKHLSKEYLYWIIYRLEITLKLHPNADKPKNETEVEEVQPVELLPMCEGKLGKIVQKILFENVFSRYKLYH